MENFKGSSDNAHKMIFISDLPKSTTYTDVSDFYEKNIGPCQICIKRPLFKNFYYAFVMFETIENAKRAMEEHRFPVIKADKMSRALPYNMQAIRGEPGGKDIQSTSIFIKGFEKVKWTHVDLYAKFCGFGKILSCKVSINADHEFLGFGYIQFSRIEEAQKAIKELDKYDLASDGHGSEGILTVSEYQGKKPSQQLKKTFNNIYVKGFPRDDSFNEEDLVTLMEQFGKIESACIMRDSENKSKGFGFVYYSDPSEAERAANFHTRAGNLEQDEIKIKEIKGVKLSDIFIGEAKTRAVRTKELEIMQFKYKKSIMYFSLFVKNFPIGTTEEELKIYFSTACQGEVTKIQIVQNTQQAFVNFEKQDQCKNAKEFAKNVLFKSQYPLFVEYCYPKEMRNIRNEENNDKKAQDKKRNQKNQEQIANLSGSQNLVDLLTALLQPAFLSQRQPRSRSLGARSNYNPNGGTPNGNTPMGPGGYQNNRFGNNQRYQNHAQPRPNQSFNHGQPMMVGQGPNPMMNNRQNSAAPPNPLPPQPVVNFGETPGMLNQSMSSGTISMGSNPQYVDMMHARSYFEEVQTMFMSQNFKTAKKAQKKDIIGNTIYKHVEKLVGDKRAPKITGMLIDLPEAELNYSISQWNFFEQKVMSALALINQNQQNQNPGQQAAPAIKQDA